MSVLTEDERDMMLQKVYAMLTELMARAEKPRRGRKRGPAWGAAWSLEEVKGFLGHKSITTTERYAHLANSALVRAAERLRNAAKTKRQH